MQSRPNRLGPTNANEIAAGVASIANHEPLPHIAPVAPGLSPA